MGHVNLMALPVLTAVARKVAAKDGIINTNGQGGPRSLWKENSFTTCETSGGDQAPISRLYTAPTIAAFGDPQRIKSRHDLYLDILNKLDWGALYFYYGDKNFGVKEETLVRHMYPFTLEEVHAGWTKGKERIVTKMPGVYGWQDDEHLHRVYRSDSRGILVPNTDFSTADSTGVRTRLRLGEREAAVVEKMPLRLETSRPCNVLVKRYDSSGLELLLDGAGSARLVIESGPFLITPGKTYHVTADKSLSVRADAAGRLSLPLEARGETRIRVSAAGE